MAITDAGMRSGLPHALVDRALAGASAVVHLVIPRQNSWVSLDRDDSHELAPIADSHGGALYYARTSADVAATTAILLGLVRPTRIDAFAVHGVDMPSFIDMPDALAEGSGHRFMFAVADPPRRVVLTGKLWATPLRRVVERSRGFDEATAAFVFSEGYYEGLTDGEMATVAGVGEAVSPVTSYVAAERGVHPSRDGIDERERDLQPLIGTPRYCGFSGEGTIGLGSEFIRFRPKSRLHELLAVGVAGCAAQHQRFGWTVDLRVETTGLEIVDVEVAGHAGASAPLRSCITELVWALELPAGRWPSREVHLLQL